MYETPQRVCWQTVKTQMKCSILLHHQGLHRLLTSGTEIYHNSENYTCDPLKYTMGSPILTVSIYMGNPIRIQRVNIFINNPCLGYSSEYSQHVFI